MKENRWGRALQRQPYGKTGAAATGAWVLLMAAVSTGMQQCGLLNSKFFKNPLTKMGVQWGSLGTRFLTVVFPAEFVMMQRSP